jgi:signal transduction histidine kinase
VFDATRRIYLYWALLLIPTLAAGVVALRLLQREQASLSRRSEQVDEARRSALSARARLVAENLELLAGDVETGLLDALAEVPSTQLEAFLARWPKENPLVRTAFLCTPGGELIRPGPGESDEAARGFRRRFTLLFGNSRPWQSVPEQTHAPYESPSSLKSESWASDSDKATANTFSVRKARQEVQSLARSSAVPRRSDPGAQAPAFDEQKLYVPAERAQSAPRFSERRGWRRAELEKSLRVLGWLQSASDGRVRGIELDLASLAPRLASSLPQDLAEGETIVLRDEQGREMGRCGARGSTSTSVLQVPINSQVLQGWRVEAQLQVASIVKSSDGGFFIVGGLLVGTFVVAILAGGSLLFWQARASARELQQKTSFVSNVSHEFKTPLTTIRLYSELLEQQRVADPAMRSEYLRTIGRETERLARLVNNVLDFSRLEQGRKQYRLEDLDLLPELDRILSAQRPRLAEAGLALSYQPPAAATMARIDRDAFEQILLNLIDNSCKYASEGGVLELDFTTAAPNTLALRLRDRGPGVPTEERERIFEKFHRVDNRLTTGKSGAGLGLSIARQLARGQGGELSCHARDGQGASFILTLPSATPPPKATQATS